MKAFKCDCGTSHTDASQCAANRAATHAMQARRNQPALPWIDGPDGEFVRFCEGEENALPHGTALAGGIVKRYRL